MTIEISFFTDHSIEYNSPPGLTLYSQQEETTNAGLYSGKDKDEKFLISIEREQLKSPERLIATLSHELAHIKILGEGRLKINDEYLTDLVTVFFGLGIFTANASFNFYSQHDRWGYNKQGYLLQQEWGYALALFAYIKQEKSPKWVKYLTPNIQSDFEKSEQFIYANQKLILQ